MSGRLFDHYEVKTVPRMKTIMGTLSFIENPIPVINDALEVYGPTYITNIISGKKLIMTIDPEVIQHVLQKNHKNYKKSDIQTESLGKYIGNGLLTSNGAYWLQQRRLIQPGFHKSKMEGLVQTMKSELDAFIIDLKERIKTNNRIEVTDAMMELTLRIVSKSLFSTGISPEEIFDLGKSFTALQEYIVKEIRQPIFNWYRKISGASSRAMTLADETKGIMRRIIAERQANPAEADDLLDMLIKSTYQDTGEKMNTTQLLDESLILFTAGHETTANALGWCLYELSQCDANVTSQLRTEYSRIASEGVNMASLMGAKYSSMVLSETMRLYPPAWVLDRVALADDRIKNVSIQKGDILAMYVYGTHRTPILWEDPEIFDTERFGSERSKEFHSYAYYPFGGGPRQCIGNHFAMLEMQMAIGELLHHFDITLDESVEVIEHPLLTLRPKNGIKMFFTERNQG